ncbi:MAG: hypothetical protein Q7U10_11710 [Thermodesulfovibrionia bacterium]|nr:hypothetical protein [Thermodesulfovibrionia bacterium]
MSKIMTKEEAHKLIEKMPEGATWDDFIHEVYVRETIEKGLEDSKAGRTKDVNEIRSKYSLPK